MLFKDLSLCGVYWDIPNLLLGFYCYPFTSLTLYECNHFISKSVTHLFSLLCLLIHTKSSIDYKSFQTSPIRLPAGDEMENFKTYWRRTGAWGYLLMIDMCEHVKSSLHYPQLNGSIDIWLINTSAFRTYF